MDWHKPPIGWTEEELQLPDGVPFPVIERPIQGRNCRCSPVPLSGVPLPPGVMGTDRPGEIEGEWWLFEEPPASVTRVRSDDGRDVVIRHRGKPKLWATIRADASPVIPQDGVTQEQGLGWAAWLDLNLMAVMYDDTLNDQR